MTQENETFDLRKSFPSRVAIIGAARSGLAAADYFRGRGVQLFISDACAPERLEVVLAARGMSDIPHEGGCHTEAVLEADLIVLSPGVRSDVPVLVTAKRRGIPIWSELELGFRASDATFLAVTGSTGKSTTVSLLGEALAAGGRRTVVAGNIGLPVVGEVADLSRDAVVAVEVSSFQLETVDTFRPMAAAVLNFMKNHLDRYADEEGYYGAKKNVAKNFTRENFLVVNLHDEKLVAWAGEMRSRTNIVFIGTGSNGAPVDGDCVWYETETRRIRYALAGSTGTICDVDSMRLGGRHNYENGCAAAALAKVAGIADEAIAEGLARFDGLPHRLEFAGAVDGVRYYNDSKSTTAESVACAISAFDTNNVHLIAGGRDKGCDFSLVKDVLQKHVKDVCLIGEAAARMQSVWKGIVPIFRPETLEEAVIIAAHQAVAGDVVVFSPGCSSFDMFSDYEERGRVFKEIVARLKPEGRAS